MPQQTQPYDYNALCSDFIARLLPIFGRDAVIQTVLSIPEIELDSSALNSLKPDSGSIRESERKHSGMISSIQGDPQVIFDKLTEGFRDLSPYVTDKVMHELHEEIEKGS